MSAPSARALLREIDRLPAPERTRRLARLARDEVATSGLEVLCADLTAGDPFARYLALQLATVDGATEIVAQLLDDPDPAVAGAAVAVAVAARMPVLYDLLVARLPALSRRQRRGLVRTVRRHVLGTLAVRLLGPVREHFGDVEGAALLSSCPTQVVEELLPELAYAVQSWPGLARHHPDAVVGHLRAELARTPASRHQEVWSHAGSAVAALATLRPHALLDLMETSAPGRRGAAVDAGPGAAVGGHPAARRRRPGRRLRAAAHRRDPNGCGPWPGRCRPGCPGPPRCGRRPGRSPRGSTAPWTGRPSTSSRTRSTGPVPRRPKTTCAGSPPGPARTSPPRSTDSRRACSRGSPGSTAPRSAPRCARWPRPTPWAPPSRSGWWPAQGAAQNWTPPWRAVLADLREHPDQRVRGDARDVVIEPE